MTSTYRVRSRNLIDCLFKDPIDKCTMQCTSNAAPPYLASFHKAPEQKPSASQTPQSIHRLNRRLLIMTYMTHMGAWWPALAARDGWEGGCWTRCRWSQE